MNSLGAAPAALFGSRSASSAVPAPPPAPSAAPMASAGSMPPPPTPAPAANPAQQQQQPPEPQQQAQQSQQQDSDQQVDGEDRDYTQVPKDMDENFERLDIDSQLRPTIITPSGNWTKRAQKALLASPTTSSLNSDDQKKEKDAAFDLLDGLTKSGAVPVDHASLHIVVAATHCFDKTVTETVIQHNANPIEKVERSTLIMASSIHKQPASAMI